MIARYLLYLALLLPAALAGQSLKESPLSDTLNISFADTGDFQFTINNIAYSYPIKLADIEKTLGKPDSISKQQKGVVHFPCGYSRRVNRHSWAFYNKLGLIFSGVDKNNIKAIEIYLDTIPRSYWSTEQVFKGILMINNIIVNSRTALKYIEVIDPRKEDRWGQDAVGCGLKCQVFNTFFEPNTGMEGAYLLNKNYPLGITLTYNNNFEITSAYFYIKKRPNFPTIEQ